MRLLPIILSSSFVLAQFVPTPTGFTPTVGNGIPIRYKAVPTGLCETQPGVKTFVGYADLAEDKHFYFSLWEASHQDPSTAPLIIWTDGGPGASSTDSAVSQLGPCIVQEDLSIASNPSSWTNIGNVLFIDQPIASGLSYSRVYPGYIDPASQIFVRLPSNNCPDYAAATGTCGTYNEWNATTTANSTAAAAPDFYATLQGVAGVFPQHFQNGVHIVTESYGGHYGPYFSAYILEQNANLSANAAKIDLKGLLIGNGWYDPISGYQAFYNYTISPGNQYDWHPYNESTQAQLYNSLYGPGNCIDQLQHCAYTSNDGDCAAADNFCANLVENVMDIVTGRDEDDTRELSPDPFPSGYADVFYNANSQAFGAYVNFTYQSYLVGGSQDPQTGGNFGATGDDARDFNTVANLKTILANNVSVVLYNGDADYVCSIGHTQDTADSLDYPDFAEAGWTNISVSSIGIQGQVKQANMFSFIRVFYSGHYVPFYQPELTLAFLNRTVHRQDIATGRQSNDGYLSKGTSTSNFHEGNGTFVYKVLPDDATYDTKTHKPNKQSKSSRKRLLKQKRSIQTGPRLM